LAPSCKWKKLAFFTVCRFWAKNYATIKFLLKQCIILKQKSSGNIITPWAMCLPISAFLLFLVSAVECGEEFAHFWHFWPISGIFIPILPQLKNFFQKSSSH